MQAQGIPLPVAYTPPSVGDTPLEEQNILVLQQQLANGTLSSVALLDHYLARIEAYDKQGPALNTLITLNTQAREQAQQLDEERRRTGPRSLLHGIPVVIKDNYNTRDMPTTGASQSLASFIPNDEATQVKKLREAGAIIVGKTNLHEFAYGITSI
ncbi:MAG: amidase, partial [Pseudohongiella sp.]|nr:amidase [Pseudohongiella sp.]